MVDTGFVCPRRDESPMGEMSAYPQTDYWRDDGTCSYCGSMHPDRFMESLEQGVQVTPTDKSYKAYIRCGDTSGKFYFQHLSDEQKNQFIQLLNSKTMNIGLPGHFYVTPYFASKINA